MLTDVSYKIVLELLRAAASQADAPFRIATMAEFMDFNSEHNTKGEHFRCMVLKCTQCGEGISFKEVRHVHMVEPPWSYTDFAQRCGRAVRLHSHSRLSPEQQTVCFSLSFANKLWNSGFGTLALWDAHCYSLYSCSVTCLLARVCTCACVCVYVFTCVYMCVYM